MKLKEFAATIPVDFVRIGFDPETEKTKFVAIVNGQSFDFSCGLRACIPDVVRNGQSIDGIDYLRNMYKIRHDEGALRLFNAILGGDKLRP